ncbi:hypothetical protein Moror_15318 [Moniliophthora roreri MCA 2997]|uniref:Uncharacterized protein n=2 Tax=Moniliophthora roreri TaxID=221103 RepID=V2X5T6_MONRO|nr:hypothetical protein Moror_15318 [Moniliophthora roreri MCA 2997]KAI3603604.1 hypothetical protein WG66_006038 [Moniliophthora roreri]
MEEGVYSPSDESEGQVLRDFVDETIAHEHDHSNRSLRTELLSSASNLGQDAEEFHRSYGHSSSYFKAFARRREQELRHKPAADLVKLLVHHEYEAKKMQRCIFMLISEAEKKSQDSEDLQKQMDSTVARFRILNERMLSAEAEARASRDEMSLYRINYEMAQNQIARAQEVLTTLRIQRDNAESTARRARSDARRVREAMEVWKAKEEGRRQGFEAGWRRAREEFGLSTGRRALQYVEEDHTPQPARTTPEIDEEVLDDDISFSAVHTETQPPIELGVPNLPMPSQATDSQPPVHNNSPPQPLPPANQTPYSHRRASSVPHEIPIAMPEPAVPPPLSPSHYVSPLHHSTPTPQAPSTVGNCTPGLERFTIDIPPADSQVVNQNINPPQPARSNSKKFVPKTWRPPTNIARQRSPSPRPPDNYIPAVSEEGVISLPPPHEMTDYAPTPRSNATDLPPTTGPRHKRSMSLDDGGLRRPTGNPTVDGQRPESWYGRGRDPRAQPLENTGPSTEAPVLHHKNSSSSWYQAKPGTRTPSVQSKDYAYPNPIHNRRASFDSNRTGSSHFSNMDLLRGPEESSKPDDGKRGTGVGSALRNMFRSKGKGKARRLSVVNEDPLSRQGSLNVQSQYVTELDPLRYDPGPSNIQQSAPLMTAEEEKRSFAQNLRYPPIANSATSNSSSEWRNQPPNEIRPDRPPRNVRAPARLIFPAPLSPENQPRVRTMSAGSMGSRFYQGSMPQNSNGPIPSIQGTLSRGNADPGRRSASVSSPPVGITVEPPSQSPSDRPTVSPSGGTSRVSLTLSKPAGYTSPVPSNGHMSSTERTQSIGRYSPAVGSGQPLPDDWVPTEPNTPESRNVQLRWPSDPPRTPYGANTSADPRLSRSGGSEPPFRNNDFQSPHMHSRSPSRTSQQAVSQQAPVTSRPPSAIGNRHPVPASVGVAGSSPYAVNQPLPPGSPRPHGNASENGAALRRVPSNMSVRSGYSHFDPESYRDPAYFALDTQPNTSHSVWSGSRPSGAM